jgi:hypothetical protein
VLANGSVANINQQSSSDLFWALRGGGNNFGIVTRFDLETYPQGGVWGGYNFHLISHEDVSARKAQLNLKPTPISQFSLQSLVDNAVSLVWRAACKLGYCMPADRLFETFQNSSLALENDLYAHILMAFVYAADVNLYLGVGMTHYTKDHGGPEVFKDCSKLPRFYSSLRAASLKEFALEDTKFNAPGFRYEYICFSRHL